MTRKLNLTGPETSSANRTVGQYQLLGEIGSGGMAVVYLAQQLNLRREVALKELRLGDTMDAASAHRFLREARLAGSFSHPNIVTVHDYFEHQGVPYIAMEYLPSGSLRPYVGDMTLPQTGAVLSDALAGLMHAEQRGVVHRDIKPENLLVTSAGGIKITDFGVAKVTHSLASRSMVTNSGNTVGTPNYLSPEQAMGHPVGPWTDLYSLGITAFELLVGRTPFGDTQEPMGIMLRHVNEVVPRVSDERPTVHPWVSDWVAWLTSKAPGDRPRDAREALKALDDILAQLLGPRWRDEAPLPTASTGGAGPTTYGGRNVLVGGIPSTAGTPGAAGSSQVMPLATTHAPSAQPSPATAASAAQRSTSGRLRRLSTMTKAGVGVLALVAGVAAGLRAQQTQTDQPSHGKADAGISSPASTPPSTSASLAPSGDESPGRTDPTIASTDVWLEAQARDARRQAKNLAAEATRLLARQDGHERQSEIRDLRRGARLYRAALDAARGASTVGASASPQAPSQPSASPAPSASSSAPTTESCAGDSTSDDPSDDECGE
jgi:serine/threonine protein kinase